MASGITTKLVETIKEFMMEGSTDEEIAELVYSEIDGMESAEEFLEIHGDILTQIRPRLSLDNQRREEAEAQAKQILAKEKEKAQKTEKVKDKRYANVTEVPKETEWTSDEETDLALYFYKDFTDLQIAKKMKRSETDVANKRKALGLNRSKNPKNEKQIKKGQLKYFGLALKKHKSLNGYTIEKIVETFEHVNGGVDVKAYKEWEAGKRYPTLAQFKWLMKRLHITKPASLFESPEVYAEVYPALQKGYKEPEDIPAEVVEEVVNTVKTETKPEEKKEIVFAKGFEEKEPVTVVNASANTPAKIPTPKPSVAVAKPVSVVVAKKVVEEPKTTVVTEKENTMDGNNNNGGIKPENIAKLERVAKRTGTTVNAVLNALIEAMKEDVQAEVKVEFKGLF